MKTLKKISAVLLTAVIVFAMCIAIMADDSKDTGYETLYTVRILQGAQGEISGGQIIYQNCKYGDTITFSVSSVSLPKDSKYYVKGLKDSGMDNSHPSSDFREEEYLTTDGAGNFFIKVTKSQDFVVSYGLKGSSVAYTVQYRDAEGNQLLPDSTYYGNVGDKPVISFLYVENYRPQAYNLTKTLAEDESQNIFRFVYTSTIPETTAAETTTSSNVQPDTTAAETTTAAATTAASDATTAADAATNANGGTNDAAGGDGTANDGANDAAGGDGAVNDGADADTTTAEAATPAEQQTTVIEDDTEVPREIIDLDTEDGTPKENVALSKGGLFGLGTVPTILICAGAAVVAGGIVLLIVLLSKRKKTDNA